MKIIRLDKKKKRISLSIAHADKDAPLVKRYGEEKAEDVASEEKAEEKAEENSEETVQE